MSYQWYFNKATISGATNNAYTLTNAQVTNAGTYYVTVKNSGGTIASSNAILSVQVPQITTQSDFAISRGSGPARYPVPAR